MEDAAALAGLLNAIIAIGGTTAHEIPFTPASIEQTYIAGPQVICCFVAEEGPFGDVVGFQALVRDQDLPEDCGDIGTFVRVGAAGQGVGHALFVETKATARRLGLSEINATIRADNAGGLAFYSRLGFQAFSVRVGAPLKDGRLVDQLNKRYRLASSD